MERQKLFVFTESQLRELIFEAVSETRDGMEINALARDIVDGVFARVMEERINEFMSDKEAVGQVYPIIKYLMLRSEHSDKFTLT